MAEEKIHIFEESKKLGDKGEQIIKDYLRSLPSINKVVDMANNKMFYHKDVDFVFQKKDGKTYRAEIKTDQYTSGNIYYETISNDIYNTEGCMNKTAADYLFYYFITWDKLYILKMDEYRTFMNELIKNGHEALVEKNVKNAKSNKKGDYIASSVGYTLPLSVLEANFDKDAIMVVNEVQKKAYSV